MGCRRFLERFWKEETENTERRLLFWGVFVYACVCVCVGEAVMVHVLCAWCEPRFGL